MSKVRLSRRNLLASIPIACVGSVAARAQQGCPRDDSNQNPGAEFLADGSLRVTESQRGDPSLPEETIQYDPSLLAPLIAANSSGSIKPRIDDFGAQLVTTASKFVGMNRKDNEREITRLCNFFRLGFSYVDQQTKKTKLTPFCAMGIAYSSALTYFRYYESNVSDDVSKILNDAPGELANYMLEVFTYHLYPGVGAWPIRQVGEATNRWIPRRDALGKLAPRPGWIVVYKFTPKDWHVGIVESCDTDKGILHTIEFNTTASCGTGQSTGGIVARRQRQMECGKTYTFGQDPSITGFVATGLKTGTAPYDKSHAPTLDDLRK